jgi:hypothetical protein
MAIELPGDDAQRKAVIFLLEAITAAALTAIATGVWACC